MMASAARSQALRIGKSGAPYRVIFGHGLGDTPHGWADVATHWSKSLSQAEFILPAAPVMPVTLNMGMEMPSWYDLPTMQEIAAMPSRLDIPAPGIEKAAEEYADYVTDAPKTFFGGFSQGGAVALYAGLDYALKMKAGAEKLTGTPPLAGIVTMSGYLPAANVLKERFKSSVSGGEHLSASIAKIPVLLCHGEQDPMVAVENCHLTAQFLQKEFGMQPQVHTFPGMGHEASMDEIDVVATWLRDRMPSTDERSSL